MDFPIWEKNQDKAGEKTTIVGTAGIDSRIEWPLLVLKESNARLRPVNTL